jgi:hypothetical protein
MTYVLSFDRNTDDDQITRVEPHRNGNGSITGLDCYSGGPGSGEVLVGLAVPADSIGDGRVRIDGDCYCLPFGESDHLQRIGDDLRAVENAMRIDLIPTCTPERPDCVRCGQCESEDEGA